MIAPVAVEPVPAPDQDGRMLADLAEALILVEDGRLVRLGCTVFLEANIERAVEVAKPYGRNLAAAIAEAMPDANSLPESMKHFIVDVLVPEAATVAMADDWFAFGW